MDRLSDPAGSGSDPLEITDRTVYMSSKMRSPVLLQFGMALHWHTRLMSQGEVEAYHDLKHHMLEA